MIARDGWLVTRLTFENIPSRCVGAPFSVVAVAGACHGIDGLQTTPICQGASRGIAQHTLANTVLHLMRSSTKLVKRYFSENTQTFIISIWTADSVRDESDDDYDDTDA